MRPDLKGRTGIVVQATFTNELTGAEIVITYHPEDKDPIHIQYTGKSKDKNMISLDKVMLKIISFSVHESVLDSSPSKPDLMFDALNEIANNTADTFMQSLKLVIQDIGYVEGRIY